MKFAIQGHPTRGHEVIQILENLGGKNTEGLKGTHDTFYYIDDKNEIGDDHRKHFPPTYNLYTIEEFETKFPFKIGDKVTIIGRSDFPKVITQMVWDCDEILYSFEGLNYTWFGAKSLKRFKMKEERNITLTLDKAKEWYNKGGELKEIALQAFTEKELNPLPRSWEEFCRYYPIRQGECILESEDKIIAIPRDAGKRVYKNWITSKKSAEAHLAMIQLEQLRNCWRQGWVPDWLNGNEKKYAIKGWRDKSSIEVTYVTHAFLSFPTYKLALEFRECFRDLIEKAGDLI